ncbi:MAG: hypothetical protein ABI528_08675 [bacterium]
MKAGNFKVKASLMLIFFSLIIIDSSDSLAQRKDTSDYFAVGVFGGNYTGQYPLYGINNLVNTVGVELEYYKFSDLSFYFQGIYNFTGNNLRLLFDIPESATNFKVKEQPETHRFIISFGGKYFLRNKDVNPFFELGINQEVNYIGQYGYVYNYDGGGYAAFGKAGFYSKLSVNLGAGLSVKLNHKFKVELKYDLYKSILRAKDMFTGYSVLGGLKYNL